MQELISMWNTCDKKLSGCPLLNSYNHPGSRSHRCPVHRQGNGDSEGLSDLHEVTQVASESKQRLPPQPPLVLLCQFLDDHVA